LVSGEYAFWLTIAFSAIGAFVLVLVLFLVWRRFKRGYLERLPGLKPEVAENTV
jgi:membrane protein DedA with SNARE-associated domain